MKGILNVSFLNLKAENVIDMERRQEYLDARKSYGLASRAFISTIRMPPYIMYNRGRKYFLLWLMFLISLLVWYKNRVIEKVFYSFEEFEEFNDRELNTFSYGNVRIPKNRIFLYFWLIYEMSIYNIFCDVPLIVEITAFEKKLNSNSTKEEIELFCRREKKKNPYFDEKFFKKTLHEKSPVQISQCLINNQRKPKREEIESYILNASRMNSEFDPEWYKKLVNSFRTEYSIFDARDALLFFELLRDKPIGHEDQIRKFEWSTSMNQIEYSIRRNYESERGVKIMLRYKARFSYDYLLIIFRSICSNA